MVNDEQVPSRLSSSKRISLPLKEDGSAIDWDRVSGTIEERFVNAVKDDPDTLEKIGLAQNPGGGDSDDSSGVGVFDGITDANIKTGLDMLSSISGGIFKMLAAKMMKHPIKRNPKTNKPTGIVIDADILQRSFTLTETQHEELDPRAKRLANKMAPAWLQKHNDLAMLAAMYLTYMSENAKTALTDQVTRDIQIMQQYQESQQHRNSPENAAQRGNGSAHRTPIVPPPDSSTISETPIA